ncbi:MATE family efflux transporter [Halanaerobiaceae bacterium Z-7014]|uniref:Probable multidrug resistance protein NorM n=1 Tax=Halonatronomonas betaini TaxID=2778430 RepID=A0A931FA00_9FIRM|nr:MATE family efflux transporter [Halonatronomonas betaini]MBF8436422.1 MATE family efflux transporter [Halonatronomonas betaini]
MKSPIDNKQEIIGQPILPTLLKLSWPIIIGQGMHLMYQLADTFWVGRLGPEYLAAISLSFPLLFIVYSMGAGFSVAGVALVSQYTGAERPKMASKATGQIFVLAILISIVFTAAGLYFSEDMFILIGAEEEVLPLALEYFRIYVSGIPIIFIYYIFSSVLEGIGDTITPMKIKIFTVVLNIILDPFLIFGWSFFPELGIGGAALATVLSRLAAGIVGIYIMFWDLSAIKLKLRDFYPDLAMIKKIVKIGTPAALGDSAMAIALTVMTAIVAEFGTLTLAAWGIANRITAVIRMPAFGMGRATGIMVGQHLGAKQPSEANKVSWLGTAVTFGTMLIVAIIFLFVSPGLVSLFTEDSAVISIGAEYLRISAFAFAFLGAQIVLSGALNGAGKTIPQTFFRLLTLWVFQIPLSYIFANQFGFGRQGVWWGIFVAKVIGLLILMGWFKKGTWQTREI